MSSRWVDSIVLLESGVGGLVCDVIRVSRSMNLLESGVGGLVGDVSSGWVDSEILWTYLRVVQVD